MDDAEGTILCLCAKKGNGERKMTRNKIWESISLSLEESLSIRRETTQEKANDSQGEILCLQVKKGDGRRKTNRNK